MNKILMLMLANSSDQQMRDMTNTALNTAYANKGDNIDLRCVLVETNNNSKQYDQNWVHTLYPNEGFNYNRFLNLGYDLGGKFFWPEFFAEKDADKKFVYISNNDVIFHEKWAQIMIETMNDNKDLDSASPISPSWQFHQDFNEEWRVHRGWDIGKNFCGWALMFKKQTWDKLFPLDTRFLFWAQDNDIAIRMDKMRMTHALISTAKVTHLTSQSFRLIPNGKFYEFTDGMGIVLNKKMTDGEYERD